MNNAIYLCLAHLSGTAVAISALVAPYLPWDGGPPLLFHSEYAGSATNSAARKPTPVAMGRGLRVASGGTSSASGKPTSSGHWSQEIWDAILHPVPVPPGSALARFAAAQKVRWAAIDSAMISSRLAAERGDRRAAEASLLPCYERYPDEPIVALRLSELMIDRGDWLDAARILTDPLYLQNQVMINVSDTQRFVEAAVLAHLGYVFAGERTNLLKMVGGDKPWYDGFRDDSPQTMEALAWYLCCGKEISDPKRDLAFAERADAIRPGEPIVLLAMCSCYEQMGRYQDAMDVLRPYLDSPGISREDAAGLRDAYNRDMQLLSRTRP